MSRGEFRNLVVGKFTTVVTGAFGPPDRTYTTGVVRENWVYQGVTRDESSGRIDGRVTLDVENGIVLSASFN